MHKGSPQPFEFFYYFCTFASPLLHQLKYISLKLFCSLYLVLHDCLTPTFISYLRLVTDPVQPGLFYNHLCPLIDWLSDSSFSSNIFQTLSIPNRKSYGAEIFRDCSSHTMCHVSRIMCHLSHVFFFIRKKIWQSGVASRWRVCYQRDLPRLVLLCWVFEADIQLNYKTSGCQDNLKKHFCWTSF